MSDWRRQTLRKRFLKRSEKGRDRHRYTVLWDAECGICLWAVRLLQRLDVHQNLSLQSNQVLPPEVTREQAQQSIVVWSEHTPPVYNAEAWATIARALPFPLSLGSLIRFFPLRPLVDRAYAALSQRRTHLSAWLGLQVCPYNRPFRPVSLSPADETKENLSEEQG
ncbi:MAG: DUF393 domain-containing protein [Nitrospinota bacterium]|nr:MAG: DUF393 domain-containing protein [Nitrospinota bacterium]